MARPKGKKDVRPRKVRNQYGFSGLDIQNIIELKNQQKTNNDISNITGFSKSQIKKICRENNIRQINARELRSKPLVQFEDTSKDTCGIYVITIYRKDGYQGHYIGSSTNIRKRCLDHKSALMRGNHYNKNLQQDFKNSILQEYRVWEIQEEKNLIKRENQIINDYVGLYNKNLSIITVDNEIIGYLNKAKDRISNDRYTINETNECWEWKYIKKTTGYGKDMQINIDGRIKYFIPHRVSYYKYNGTYPELIRHKCNNRACINPNHLEAGSYKENAIDTHIKKWDTFKEKWTEFNGDYVKLTEYFGYKKNYKAANGDIYCKHMPQIAKRLGLI
jgi:hypothetical protein